MARAEMKPMGRRKKIIPLVMALSNKIINSLGFVEKIDASVEWDKKQWSVSPGKLLKAVVISTFMDIRTPLTRLSDRLSGIDLRYLIGEEMAENDINSFNTGRALERVGEADCDGIYETLALSAVKMNNIPMERLHSDTTTISFYGEYDIDKMDLTEEEKAELLEIERGYNKDGKPECKQMVLGQIVNEAGIPIVSRAMDGSTSDVEWNKEAIKYLRKIQQEGFSSGIYVADCKLINSGLVSNLLDGENPVKFVSRCPANFEEKLESRIIKKAYAEGKWEEYGQLSVGKESTGYRGVSYTETVCDHPMRLLVVESTSLAEKAEAAIDKEKEQLMPLIAKLMKKNFACHADALAESNQFFSDRRARLFQATTRIERTVKEKWPPGRRKANALPKISETFKIVVEHLDRDVASCQSFIQSESCFVLISNVFEELNDNDLLATYKGQQIVENSFRLLKQPQLASVIFLKNPFRINALSMILSFALLIRAIIQHRLRDGLKSYKQEHPKGKLSVGWNGRELTSPTYKLLYEHSFDCYFEREGFGNYSFAWPFVESKERVGTLLWLMGLDVLDLIE
jgi:transposase